MGKNARLDLFWEFKRQSRPLSLDRDSELAI